MSNWCYILFPLFISLIGCNGQDPVSNSKNNTPIEIDSVQTKEISEEEYLSFQVDPKKDSIKFFWKDENNKPYYTFKNLKSRLDSVGKKLIFAANGGIFTKEHKPLGLYIEDGKILRRINRVQKAYGNFYLQPNGIFYITKSKKAHVVTTKKFIQSDSIQYATQSGPMLVINDTIHPKFNKISKNKNIRNGVGILPDGNILFIMSKKRVTLYDFAMYFKEAGCRNALYLDGSISKTYCPSKGYDKFDGKFIVFIAVTE